MSNTRAACAITGKTGKLNVHAFRNANGDIIGTILLSEEISAEIDLYDINVKVNWDKKRQIEKDIELRKN